MEVLIPAGSGFCPGVLNAEKKLLKIREKHQGNIYISGMFIHNKEYEKYLENQRIISIKEYKQIPPDSVFVISTHGLDKLVEKDITKNCIVYDLTCLKVKNVQNIISSYKNYFTIITGKENHPEVLGLKSYSQNNIIISDVLQLDNKKILDEIINKNILLISQTTADSLLFERTLEYLNKLYSQKSILQLASFNTICPSIKKREINSVNLLIKIKSKAIVIGDYLSSNSQRLFTNIKKITDDVFFIEKLDDLKNIVDKIKNEKRIMVVSSSSTPSFIEKEIIDFLSKI